MFEKIFSTPRRFGLWITAALLSLSFVGEAATEKLEKLVAADELLAENEAICEKYTFQFKGSTFVGYPDVYSPVIFPGASKQTDLLVRKGERFLEMGCGTGVFSIQAALDGAEEVVAIDINPSAVANARENAQLHDVEDVVTVFQGDMFAPLAPDQRFDVIFFNIPFCHRNCPTEELSMLGRSLFDPEHDLLYRFLKEGANHLSPNGRLILGYSTTHGDIEQMYAWASQYGWDVSLLHKSGDEKTDFITVELYEFRKKK